MLVAQPTRAFPRIGVVRPGTLTIDGEEFDCVVQNLSKKGAKLCLTEPVKHENSSVVLKIPDFGEFEADIAWTHGPQMGLSLRQETDFEIFVAEAAPSLNDILAMLDTRSK